MKQKPEISTAVNGTPTTHRGIMQKVKRSFFGSRFWIAFVMASTLSLSACSDSGPSAAEKASKLLQQEVEEGQRAQALFSQKAITALLQLNAENIASGGNDYSRIVAGMRKLSLSRCPRDFAAAYVDYIHAWEDAAEIQNAWNKAESNENIKDLIGTELLQKLFGSNQDAINDAAAVERRLKSAASDAQEDIKKTHNKVEHIAATYGATLP